MPLIPQQNDPIADALGIEFALGAEGFPVARTRELVLAMITTPAGSFLASAWRPTGSLSTLKRQDFYRHDGPLADEAAFVARVTENAAHQRDVHDLGRVQARMSCSTPWGMSQSATIYGPGIVSHTTAGHGGFHLSSVRNIAVPSALRNDTCWYEEDVEWAVVAHAFPELFTGYERRTADETIRHSWPEFWETVHGRSLAPGESRAKDRQEFESIHADNWIVTSAIFSKHHTGMTEVVARRGTERKIGEPERRYLVDSAQYAGRGPFGFVIDETRHQRYDGPSSFVGWSRPAA
ncbi:hypothetical protein HW571_19845 [Agrobacterium genomosp. 3]|uniref:DUF7007 domain-containing protein n=1 Tax=Agrobacterium TaxID=357 RepID=UPI001CD8246D|nr:hypothetical protein [Agrobacterium pusense]MCA1867934.1 hypothetical protein [Agrobacterium tomkonis]MCA1878373.1 hypothetical protein [Agrobacterium tumefaciens]MCA1893509.1 hypothetical protein [Agrobacterium tomkonis]MDH0874044.1 hypothetical protein [Agrobacterium pusense]